MSKLVRGDQLPSSLRRQVLARYVHRWTSDNPQREHAYRGYEGKPTIPLVSDEQWLREHAFYVTDRGTLDARRKHAEPAYMIEDKGAAKTHRATKKSSASERHHAMKTDDPELDKLHSTYMRLLNKGIALEDAGRTDPKLDAAIDRARDKLQAARRGESTKKSATQLECEIAKTLAETYTKRTGNPLEVRKELKDNYGSPFGWFVYHWIPGTQPDLLGPFRNEITACKKMAEIAAG